MESPKQEQVLDLRPSNIKDILLYSLKHKNINVTIYVPPSRFRKILSDYYSMNGISIEGAIDRYSEMYSSYTLSRIDKTGNVFKIQKGLFDTEVKGKCKGCNCKRKERWINKTTGQCFYNEMITTNYTTKIE